MEEGHKVAVGNPGLLRELNHRAVLETIAVDGPQSRVAISERLRLSQTSVSRVVETLLRAGVLVEGNRIPSALGRRQTLLDVNPDAATVAGVSVRPYALRIVLANLKGERLCLENATTKHDSPHSLVDQITDLLKRGLSRLQLSGSNLAAVSVGLAGAWDQRHRRVHSARNLQFLENVDLLGLLQQALPVDPDYIHVENDINYAALGELSEGAGEGFDSLYYLSLGSGVGGGVVINRHLHRGLIGFAGEIGYLPIAVQGHLIPLEDLVSSAALSTLAASVGAGTDAGALFAAAERGDAASKQVVDEILKYLALGICSIVTALDPELIVIGGSVSKIKAPYLIARLAGIVGQYIPEPSSIVESKLGNDAHMVGAIAQAIVGARTYLVTNTLAASGA